MLGLGYWVSYPSHKHGTGSPMLYMGGFCHTLFLVSRVLSAQWHSSWLCTQLTLAQT